MDEYNLEEENKASEQKDRETEYNPYLQEQREPGRKRRRKKPGFAAGMIAGILSTVLVLGIGVSAYTAASGQKLVISGAKITAQSRTELLDSATVDKIDEITDKIDDYFADEADEDAIRDEILHAVVDGLGDPYSEYYTAQEYQDLIVSLSGVYYGIGAGLKQDKETMVVTVSKVYSGTPAEEAGLMNGDIIEKVDDITATSMELSDLVQNIRGEEGTYVHLVVTRNDETLEFDVERRNIVLPSVEGEMLDDHIGYIQISEFQQETAEQFKEIYQQLINQGMEGMIVDVRSNPGGYLTTVVDLLDFILPEGLLVYTEDKYGNVQEYNSDASCIDTPMVVLMDSSSASASEIFAGALKDYDRATLVGTTTYGKGIVQTSFPLSDGDALKLTTAKYYTPNGNYIHGIGIDPDVEIEYEWLGPEDADTYEKQYDNQLQKAIEVLQEDMAQY